MNGRRVRVLAVLCVAVPSVAAAQTDWQKYPGNPVMVKDTTLAGVWEWAGIGQPTCLHEDDTSKVWYAAAGVSVVGDSVLRGRIGYAFSVDGINWTKHGSPSPVLNVGDPGQWDSRWLDTPAVVRDDDCYRLYYYGDSLDAPSSALGLATSFDGIDWVRHDGNPVLTKAEDFLDWDGFWIESPTVLYDSQADSYRMWYTGVGCGPGLPHEQSVKIGYATSPDGVTWTKDTLNNPVLDVGEPGEWDDGWVAVPSVKRVGAPYEMWYCGASVADFLVDGRIDTLGIGYAVSPDGIVWTKYDGNPVLSTWSQPADTAGPWAPAVIFDGIDYAMLYEAAGPAGSGIYSATSPPTAARQNWGLDILDVCSVDVHPNPFTDRTTVQCHLPQGTAAALQVYDPAGNLVRVMAKTGSCPAILSTVWDGRDCNGALVGPGLYVCRLSAGGTRSARTLVLRR
jgi:hypothetical protein